MKRHTTTPVAPQRAVSDPSDAGLPSAEVLQISYATTSPKSLKRSASDALAASGESDEQSQPVTSKSKRRKVHRTSNAVDAENVNAVEDDTRIPGAPAARQALPTFPSGPPPAIKERSHRRKVKDPSVPKAKPTTNPHMPSHDQLFAMLGLGRYEGHDAQLTIDEIVEKYHITDRNNVIQKVKHGLMDLFPPANEQDIRWYKHWLRNMERLRVRLVKPLNSTLPAGEARENTPCMLHFYEFMTRTCLGFTKEGGRPRDRTKKAADTQVAMGSEVETGEMLSANTFDDGSGVAALNSNAEERLYPMPDNGSGSSFDRNVFTANGRPAIPSSSFHMIETPAQSTPVLESERSLQNNFFAANDESANPSLSLPIVETPTQIFEESTAAKVTDVETPTAGSMTGRHNLETPMLRLDDKKRPRETESEQPAASVSEDEDEETVQRHSKRSKLGKDTGGAGHHWQGSEIETEYVAESLNEMTARVDAEQMAQQNLLQGFAYDIRQEEQFNLQGGFNEGLGAPDFLSSEDQWAHPQRIGSTFMAMEPNSWAPNFRLAPIEAVPQVEEVQQVPAKNYGPYYCLNAEYTQARYH